MLALSAVDLQVHGSPGTYPGTNCITEVGLRTDELARRGPDGQHRKFVQPLPGDVMAQFAAFGF